MASLCEGCSPDDLNLLRCYADDETLLSVRLLMRATHPNVAVSVCVCVGE